MSATDEIWEALARGETANNSNPHVMKLVLVRLRNTAAAPSEAERHQALAVARHLGTDEALRVAAEYAADASLEIRRALLHLALGEGSRGIPILRSLVSDPDPGLAVDAVRRLHELGDRASTSRVRALLDAQHAVVRNRAAVFLGHHGGPSLVPTLRRHAEDPDQGVRGSVAWAIEHIEGKTVAPAPAMGTTHPGTEAVGAEAVEAAARATPSAAAPPSPAETPPPPAPAPAPPAGRPPTETEGGVLGVMRALGVAPDGEHSLLAARLAAADESELSAAFRARKPGVHPDLNRGAALAAAHLGNPRWLTPVRKLATDPEARVRAAVAKALGALCTPAVYPSLEELARDEDPTVQSAAVVALSEGARRAGYLDAARRLLDDLPETADSALADARKTARDLLDAS